MGASTETITVTSAPPLVNTTDAVLGRTVEGSEIIGLPLVNRNAYSEISLTPGVMANNNSPTSNPSGSPNFTVGLPSADVQINGSIDGGNPEVAFYLDGGNNITGMRNYGNPAPNPDALEEFRVETSAFGAQYGQFSAAVITVITKSGTNKFHGGLFEFNRNTDFNAYPWAASRSSCLITATSLAVTSAVPSSTTRLSSSSAMAACVKQSDHCSRAPSCPRLTSVWATLPRTPLHRKHAWHQDAGEWERKHQPELPGCYKELHTPKPSWIRPLQTSTT